MAARESTGAGPTFPGSAAAAAPIPPEWTVRPRVSHQRALVVSARERGATEPVSETAGTSATPALTTHAKLLGWVDRVAELTQPDAVHWCDGSAEEYDSLCQELVDRGTFEKLSDAKRPNSYLARSDPGDVARVEDRTFICSEKREEAGPTNNWRDPQEMREVLEDLFKGAMRG